MYFQITLAVGTVFYLFLGFDETWRAYGAAPRNGPEHVQFLIES